MKKEKRKKKKITVTFFLNKNKMKQRENETGEKIFPVYTQVTYNRQVQQFRSLFVDECFSNLGSIPNGALEEETELIKKTIRYELITNENFKLVGLKEKLIKYSTTIFDCIEATLKKDLISDMREKIHDRMINALDLYSGIGKNKVVYLYISANRIFKEYPIHIDKNLEKRILVHATMFPFPDDSEKNKQKIINWIDGSYQFNFFKKADGKEMKFPIDDDLKKWISDLIEYSIKYFLK